MTNQSLYDIITTQQNDWWDSGVATIGRLTALTTSFCFTCKEELKMGKRKTHEEYVGELEIINQNIKPIEKYINTDTAIKHKCIIDGYMWPVRPKDLLRGCGCPVCAGKTIGQPPEYKNSIWASTHKEYFAQYMTEDQMKSYTPASGKRVQVICPKCGQPKEVSVHNLLNGGLRCGCGNHGSFPNKFVFNVLQQLQVDVEQEYTPTWANGKRYDLYISSLNLIIENHGLQHYEERYFRHRTLAEEQENDVQKEKMAVDNNIKIYVVLNCRSATGSFIKQSIMQSCLPTILNFTEDDINWHDAEKYAYKDLTIDAIELYNNGLSIKQIASTLSVSRGSIQNWLRKASLIGLCQYDGKQSVQKYYKENQKRVLCIELNKVFDSVKEAAQYFNTSPPNISRCLHSNYNSTSCGYHWKLV